MHLNIIGTRGVPAAHGGFETFAEKLSLYLVSNGWSVNVYCQDDEGVHDDGNQDRWNGVTRTFFQARRSGPVGTMEFDLKCLRHVLTEGGVDLVLGYNTAVFSLLQRFKGRRILMNMDGIEWKRSKWGIGPKAWFFVNEIIGANLAHVPIADHPEIARHVSKRSLTKPVMIPYGSDEITEADAAPLADLGLEPDRYVVSIARIEPENSILELVESAATLPDGIKGIFLGKLDPDNAYHRAVKAAGAGRVLFPGAIYDQPIVKALRFHARAYMHGHQVGGTNPSLVEALGAGNAVLAHDNHFNRWTAGEDQAYFSDRASCTTAMHSLCLDDDRVQKARRAARLRHQTQFQWANILAAYETVLKGELAKVSRSRQ